MTMPQRDEPFDEHPEEQEQEQGWYFDLPSGAWERTRQVHRQLREQLLEGKPGDEKRPERDPFTGLPIEQPKGLFGRFRRKKPRLPEELERELRTRERSQRRKQTEEHDDWSTEGRALSVERAHDEAPLNVRRSAPPPPPAAEESAAPKSRWDQIFGGVEETESPMEAMRRWARGESLTANEEGVAERETADEAEPLESEEAEEPDPIIEFMSHELARRARARWEEEHGTIPLSHGVEETAGVEQGDVIGFENGGSDVEPDRSQPVQSDERAAPGRSMRWEDAFGSPSIGAEEEGLEAMRRWARGEPLAHGAGWERFERPQDEAEFVIDATEDELAEPHIERRRSIFERFWSGGHVDAQNEDGVEASADLPSEAVMEESEPLVAWAPAADVAPAGDEFPTTRGVEESSADQRGESAPLDDEWSWAPEPTSTTPLQVPASGSLRVEPPPEPGPTAWAAWGFGDDESNVAGSEPQEEGRLAASPAGESADWMVTWEPEEVALEPSVKAVLDTPAESETGRFSSAPTLSDSGLAEAGVAEEGAESTQAWWDVFEVSQADARAEREPEGEPPHPASSDSPWSGDTDWAAAGDDEWAGGRAPRTRGRSEDELLAAWEEIAAASGVDPTVPPPPPMRSSAVRRQAWDITAASSPEAKAEKPERRDEAGQHEESLPAASREEPLWVPAKDPREPEDEDIILKAFEAHAAAADDDQPEPAHEPSGERRRRLSLRDLLGEDAEDLLAAADEDEEPISFAQMHGWVTQSSFGTEEETWAPAYEGQLRPMADSAAEPVAEPVSRRRHVNWVREVVEIGLMAVLLFLAIRATFQNFQVDGTSMYPTLVDGEFLLVNKLAYQTIDLERLSTFLPFIDPGDDGKAYVFGPPQRGDIVVFRDPMNPSIDLIKRVIALPGEKVEIVGGKVFINDQLLEEPYVQGQWLGDRPAAVVPEGHYFVLGDNRDNSKDSRSAQIGYVPEDLIIGKAIVTLWPRDRLGLAPNDGGTLVDDATPTESARRVD